MRIAVDARELTGQPTGVGRYLRGILQHWQGAGGRGHEFLLYAHRPFESPAGGMTTRLFPGQGGTWWEQTTLAKALRADGCDALYAPGYTAPLLSGVKTAVVVHDVSFVAHPEWFAPREGWRRRLLTRRTAVQAGAVITVSNFSRSEIARYFPLPPGLLHVVPPGIDSPAIAAPRTSSSAQARLLYVGSIFNRRHVPALIAATTMAMARRPSVALDIVGDNRTFPHIDLDALIAASPGRDQIHWHRYVSEAELQMLYGSARAFAYLSEYEGFGLTPLEALSIGIPPLLLDTPAARETCGAAALFVAKGDVQGTSAAIEQVLFDEPTRTRLLRAAPAVLARYRWDTAASATLDIIEGMV